MFVLDFNENVYFGSPRSIPFTNKVRFAEIHKVAYASLNRPPQPRYARHPRLAQAGNGLRKNHVQLKLKHRRSDSIYGRSRVLPVECRGFHNGRRGVRRRGHEIPVTIANPRLLRGDVPNMPRKHTGSGKLLQRRRSDC